MSSQSLGLRACTRCRGLGAVLAGMVICLMVSAASASATSNGVVQWGALPTPLESPGGVAEVSAGGPYAALLDNGTVVQWRGGVPEPVSGLTEVTAISSGATSLLALLSDGRVMAVGWNEYGQLGDGNTEEHEGPVEVLGITDAVAVSSGDYGGMALLGDGTVKAWGDNANGELGQGSFYGPETCGFEACSDTPVTVPGLTGVKAIDAGATHELALLSDGTVRTWGNDTANALGEGAGSFYGTGQDKPVEVAGLSGITAVSAGLGESLALHEDGTVSAWANNYAGQLGDNKPPINESSRWSTPVTVEGLSDVVAIASGGWDNVALRSDGTVMDWGRNNDGDELGIGIRGPELCKLHPERDEEERNGWLCSRVPVPVSELTGVTSIAVAFEGGAIAAGPLSQRVTGVSPGTGGGGGGTEVTITGTNLSGATAVHFGAATSPSITVNSQTSITAEAPPGTGIVDVTVTTPEGTTPVSPRDSFRYASSVTAIGPGKGPASGGTEVAITGTNFTEVDAVRFGTEAAAHMTINSQTSITAEAPPGTGAVDVTVETTGGTSETSAQDIFTYIPQPSISALAPSAGIVAGTIRIKGSNLAGATGVSFGTTPATSFSEPNGGEIAAVVPKGIGTVDVRVTTVGGTSPITTADQFTYTPSGPVPTIAKLAPKKGVGAGGTRVVIHGTELKEAVEVDFGGRAAEGFTVVSATEVTALSPPAASGIVDVTVTTTGGTSPISPADHFEYQGTSVLGVAPNHGSRSGGTSVTISGSGFVPGTTATSFKFGKVLATEIDCTSSSSCTASAPAQSKAGAVDVRAAVAKKTSKKNSPADRFTYE
jgi:IPT/TIG domain/Regulator of chromosome condensation (RCC1) repeat